MRVNLPALLALSLLAVSAAPAYAHFEHFSHYNGRGEGVGQYYVYETLEPDYASPGEPTAIMFSVQDHDGRDTYNIETMVEVYSSSGDVSRRSHGQSRRSGTFQSFTLFRR
jgi:hypothetical protein